MKTVGIITCFADNYGACLQAFALQNTIESLGYSCSIINYVEPVGNHPIKNQSVLVRIAKSNIGRRIRSIIDPGYRASFMETGERAIAYNRFRKKHMKITKKEYEKYSELKNDPPIFDAYVCGSDQIWNPLFYGINYAHFLDFAPFGKPRIAYAPSIGISFYPEDLKEQFRNLVLQFDHLSCRESVGAGIIEEICHRKCEVVLDPTLLMNSADWQRLITREQKKNNSEKYIFCYTFSKFSETHEYIKRVQVLTGYNVFYLPTSGITYESEKFTCIYNAGPLEFLNLVNNAELVITDSFHCTVFAVQFRKSFFTLFRNNDKEKNNMNSRISGLLSMLDLEDRLVTDYLPTTYSDNLIDYDAVEKKLSMLRQKSVSFLTEALKYSK